MEVPCPPNTWTHEAPVLTSLPPSCQRNQYFPGKYQLIIFFPLISGMYHFQQNFCQEKFLRLELLVYTWKNHLGGSSNQQLGQDNGGTSAGLFQCRSLT